MALDTDEHRCVVLDDLIVAALILASDLSHGDRDAAEDLVRNRLVAMSDSYPTRPELLVAVHARATQ